jgi:hypothetical protein
MEIKFYFFFKLIIIATLGRSLEEGKRRIGKLVWWFSER